MCDGGGCGGGPPVPLGVGGRLPLCHRNSSKHFREATSKKTTRLHNCTSVHVKVAENYETQHCENTGTHHLGQFVALQLASYRRFSITKVCRDETIFLQPEVDH